MILLILWWKTFSSKIYTNCIKKYQKVANEYLYMIIRPINVQYINLLKTKVEQGLVVTSNQQDTASPTKTPVVNSIKNVQEKVKLFLINCKIFEKAIKVFTGNLNFFGKN